MALHHLVQTVPSCVCTPQTTIQDVMSCLITEQDSQTSEIIVGVDLAYRPLGRLALHRILANLNPLVTSAHATCSELLEPLPLLPFNLEKGVLPPSPQRLLQSPYYAVLDHRDRFQGVINSRQLVQTLMADPPITAPPHIERLRQFLDTLPLPLMLQSQAGSIWQTNPVWQQQLGDTVTPEILQSHHYLPGVAIEFCLDGNLVTDLREIGSEPFFPSLPLAPSTTTPKTWQLLKFPLAPLFDSATPLWLILAKDITEYRQLSQELAAKNADLIQLNRLKDEFLACITHELKTPLTAMLGLASLLKEAKLGALNPRQTQYAQLIHQSGRHLMNVVNDILDLTRLETGQLQLNWDVVDLERVCRRAYAQASQTVHSSAETTTDIVPFTLTIEPGLTTIVADELRLRQMLRHLLENALKFTPTNGEVGLTISRWQGWIDLTIWDTGIGIPESEQHLLFQKFQQLESPLTREFEGTGLGLVLTQRLARAHGGDVSFISRPGQGSQFTLLLPPHPPTTDSHANWTRSTLPNQLILVVEAVPQYIDRLTHQLHDLGYRVVVARSGTEALDKARQLRPRVILLNPLLPLLSGWDVLTLLKADAQSRPIPVLITATQAEKQQARQYGADGFLSLPTTPEALVESFGQLQLPPHGHPQNITVLYLRPGQVPHPRNSALLQALGTSMGQRPGQLSYRIVEAEDIEQAEVLTRVWQPQVLLLDGQQLETPERYLDVLSQSLLLARLPLVTLDSVTTRAAHQLELMVFPCLMSTGEQDLEALFQAIQVAAGLKTQPQILIMTLGRSSTPSNALEPSPYSYHEPSSSECLQALAQYLQTAGMRVCLTSEWSVIRQQLHQGNGDLLLLYADERVLTINSIETLQQLKDGFATLSILLLEHAPESEQLNPALPASIQQLCDRIISFTQNQTMDELFDYIQETVG